MGWVTFGANKIQRNHLWRGLLKFLQSATKDWHCFLFCRHRNLKLSMYMFVGCSDSYNMPYGGMSKPRFLNYSSLVISKLWTFHETEELFERPGTEVSFVFGLEPSTTRSIETITIMEYKSRFHIVLVLPSCQAHLIIGPRIWSTPSSPSHHWPEWRKANAPSGLHTSPYPSSDISWLHLDRAKENLGKPCDLE